MIRRVILEGCDGTGKTTLANILAREYNLEICHCTQHDPADYDFYRNSMRKANTIWDRHTIGELIYPEIFKRKAQISTEDVRLVIHYAGIYGVKIFVLTADPNVIYERLIARGNEHPLILENYIKIDEMFRFYAKQYGVPIIDTSKMTVGEMINLIK